MNQHNLKKLSIFSLIMGYFFFFSFCFLIIFSRNIRSENISISPNLGVENNSSSYLYVKNPPTPTRTHLDSAVIGPEFVSSDEANRDTSIVRSNNSSSTYLYGSNVGVSPYRQDGFRDRGVEYASPPVLAADRAIEVDRGILDRRLRESYPIPESPKINDYIQELNEDVRADNLVSDLENIGLDRGGNNNIDATRFELDEEGGTKNAELGDVRDFKKEGDGIGKGTLPGIGEGSQIHAYSFPSQGVGAGIGNAGVGAAAGYAGIGAGIGQAVLNGVAVATLGGIGTAPISTSNLESTPENDKDGDGVPALMERELGTDPLKADTDGDGVNDGAELAAYSNPLSASSTPSDPGSFPLAQLGGVGGLSNGAGAGASAGLVTGKVKPGLGAGIDTGSSAVVGTGGAGEGCNVDHLPPNGSLHIMMHVDGSGSILNTRKQLDIMKETLLKKALLPYYNNDESLYDKRVTIVDGNGERTLQFFKAATQKNNVLAVVFQDEAAPDYHLPTFNKIPQNKYEEDLHELKLGLNSHRGLYRGIMFQVDRGNTFAKSFKEFVESSWNGTGYLQKENLKKFHRDENSGHIKNNDGIVFSDEYHAKSEGNSQYYLDLIFKASRRIGLDLDIHGGGLTDGQNVNKR